MQCQRQFTNSPAELFQLLKVIGICSMRGQDDTAPTAHRAGVVHHSGIKRTNLMYPVINLENDFFTYAIHFQYGGNVPLSRGIHQRMYHC